MLVQAYLSDEATAMEINSIKISLALIADVLKRVCVYPPSPLPYMQARYCTS